MKLFFKRIPAENVPVKRRVIYPILSFFIPLTVLLTALAGLGVAPFGDHTLVISDGNAFYVNYLSYVGRAIKGLEGITYSFEKGLGGNMMDSWGWTLLNPLFALFALFDITAYPTAFTWISVLNFSACGLAMYILLANIYGSKRSNLIFSTSYALNGFLTANVFQMNFFMGVFALPLMMLGLRKLLQNRNPLLYILALTYSLFTNFYFGFMLCVASVLFYGVHFFVQGNVLEHRRSVAVKYSISSVLAGTLSCVVWLPALLALRGGRLDQTSLADISFKENMPFLEIAAKLFTGANTTAELVYGLPNIFVGILPIALVVLFFMNSRIDKKRKLEAGILLGAYLLSFYITGLDMLMHGGTVTNWFNFRYSFVFSFLLLLIAAEEWNHIAEAPSKDLKRTAAILLLSAIVIFSKRYEFVNGGEVVLDFALLSVMFLALRMYQKDPDKNPRRTFELVVLILVSINLFLNYRICTKNIMEWETKVSEYQETVTPVSILVDVVQNSDGGFYRMEIGEQRSGTTGNDPMLYGYYGVGHGGSDDRNFVRTALSALGVHRFDMRNYYGKGIPAATDTLLGLKYIISKEDLEEEKNDIKLIDLGDWALYQNPYALPIAVVAASAVSDVEIGLDNIFGNLNAVWSAMTGIEDSVFQEESEITFSLHNITDPMEISQTAAASIVESRDAELGWPGSGDMEDRFGSSDSNASSSRSALQGTFQEKPQNTNYIMFTWTASQDGAVYTYNRSGMTESKGSFQPALNYEGYYRKGDIVTGYLPVPGSMVTEYLLEEVAGQFKAAYADDDVLAEMSRVILDRPTTIEKSTDSHLRGTFTVENDQLLMFTIPYDEGWTLTIDGQKAEIRQVLGVFMAAEAAPGTHTYEMKYVPPGLKIGAVVAVVALLMLVALAFFDKRKKAAEQPVVFPMSKEVHSWIIGLALMILALLICMKSSYNLFSPFQQRTDPSVFQYVGKVMSKGGVMYRDVFDHKGPLLYFLNWLGVCILPGNGGVWIIEYSAVLISAICTYRTFRLFFKKTVSILGACIVLLALYAYFESGNTVEEYALPFILGALYVFTRYFLGKQLHRHSVSICGFCFSCVLLLRQNMTALWVVFCIAVLVREWKNPRGVLHLIIQFLIGVLTAAVPFALYLVFNDAFVDFFEQYILFNFCYSSTGLLQKVDAVIVWLNQLGSGIVILVSLLLLLIQYDKKQLCIINLIYHLVNVLFISIAGTTFLHYGIILVPGYVLTAALLLDYLSDKARERNICSVFTGVVLLLAFPWLRFIWVELPVQHEVRYQTASSVVSAIIWNNTELDDRIIVCGNRDIIYLEAEREAASKYSYQLPIADHSPAIYEEFLNDLEENVPEVIVLDSNTLGGSIDFTNLNTVMQAYLSKHPYVAWGTIGEFTIYGRSPLSSMER